MTATAREPARVSAQAKVNLALHVTARRRDGFHRLDSLVVFADVADRLSARPEADFSLRVTGPFAAALAVTERPGSEDADNLILRAARALRQAWPETYGGCAFVLDKRLPVAAGIGGGSADAAAALRAMVHLYGPPPHAEPETALSRLALELGADVPVCLSGRACRMGGIGEVIAPLPRAPRLHGLLVNPGVAVPTAAVFAGLGLAPGESGRAPLEPPPSSADTGSWMEWLVRQRNDLQAPAMAEAPVIKTCLNALRALPGARLARMSGSGATCFALFDDATAARTAARALAARRPKWWIRAVTLGDAPSREEVA